MRNGKMQATWRALKQYHGYNKKYFPLRFLQIAFEAISPYFNLWMSAEIVTALYEGRDKRAILTLVVITLVGNFAVRVLEALLNRTALTANHILKNNENLDFYAKTMSLDYDKLENPEIRTLRRRIQENTYINGYGVFWMKWQIERLMNAAVNVVFAAILFAEMLAQVATVPFHWMSTALLVGLIASLVLTILLGARSAKKIAAYNDEIGKAMLKENQYAQGYNPNGMDNRIYRQQEILSRLDEKLNREHLQLITQAYHKQFHLHIPCEILSKLTEVSSYLIICLYCSLGAFAVGSVIKYVGYLGRATQSISSIFQAISELRANNRFCETYLEYFDIPNDMYQGSLAVEKRSDKRFDIAFKDVSFRYPGSEQYALRHVNLDLNVGERLAVVGMNGSGKTTFIKLLCRLYDPTEGEIVMNDFNIRKYDYRQYLDIFSVVFQDYKLLAVPLGNNVASGANWDTEKAERLLREVGFGERYAEMPKGLETPLYKNFDEDGVLVSGGEAQKIALARALYKDAPFIILDEPTAALDPLAEAEIYAKFDAIVGDKTAIYISHRLSSCRFCDKIAVFDEGEIVQIGSHEELLRDESGKYYELWHAQAQYYT
ncbi:MAG: ABC transporter ATP-binding protein [Ruminococcaceae bacterium]|nr:ABC transporter ATP-binding protein [Oscillospiraceae bacterium]